MRRAAALSSLSRFLPHRPTNTLRALTCFNPPYQLPCLPYLSFELPTEKKIPKGPKTFTACSLRASRTGLGFLAEEKSFSLQKS